MPISAGPVEKEDAGPRAGGGSVAGRKRVFEDQVDLELGVPKSPSN